MKAKEATLGSPPQRLGAYEYERTHHQAKRNIQQRVVVAAERLRRELRYLVHGVSPSGYEPSMVYAQCPALCRALCFFCAR